MIDMKVFLADIHFGITSIVEFSSKLLKVVLTGGGSRLPVLTVTWFLLLWKTATCGISCEDELNALVFQVRCRRIVSFKLSDIASVPPCKTTTT